jgi:pyruvate-formate lyase
MLVKALWFYRNDLSFDSSIINLVQQGHKYENHDMQTFFSFINLPDVLTYILQDLLNDVEESMIEYKTSIQNLRKDSKYTLDKVVIGESDLQRGRTDLR